jgi:outer membrane phospholipase A
MVKQHVLALHRPILMLSCLGMLIAGTAHAAADAAADSIEPDAASSKGSLPGPNQLFLSQLTFYERNYFISGFSKYSQAKFQLSLKYNLWPNETAHAVYVGYTQLSLWDIYVKSGPFTEINFSPILYHEYRVHKTQGLVDWYCGASRLRLALDHSSNGAGGTASRAFNRLSSALAFGCYGANDQHFEVDLRAWPPLIFDSENENMEQYIGYSELTLEWRSPHSNRWYGNVELAAKFRKGEAIAVTRGTMIFDAAWNPDYGPATARVWRFMPYFYAQFFTGYYDSLQTYDLLQTHFRVGIGINDIADGLR